MLKLLTGMQKIKENLLWLQGSITIIKDFIADYITELSLFFCTECLWHVLFLCGTRHLCGETPNLFKKCP